jgi:LAO/AO transport system kinase
LKVSGLFLIEKGLKVAVLAIDPSSQKTKGSILGDKTRMEKLAHNPGAYIRPSASGKTIGGVARKTRETMLLCEAAGFDVIVIETVGVGQSEVEVRNLVDFFLLLMLAGAGDELQGIKKGIMEMADAIAINKADGQNLAKAKLAMKEYRNAIHLFRPNASGWFCKTTHCSALEHEGIDKIWEIILQYWTEMTQNQWITTNRQNQNLSWLHNSIQQNLLHAFYQNDTTKEQLEKIEKLVAQESIQPHNAADLLLKDFLKS